MQVKELLKKSKRIDITISINDSLILGWKETASMFLGDSENDKEYFGICLAEAKKIKDESEQLLSGIEKIKSSLMLLQPVHRKVLELFYFEGNTGKVCCEILGCNNKTFYDLKVEAIQELERIMEHNDETFGDI